MMINTRSLLADLTVVGMQDVMKAIVLPYAD